MEAVHQESTSYIDYVPDRILYTGKYTQLPIDTLIQLTLSPNHSTGLFRSFAARKVFRIFEINGQDMAEDFIRES